jgi:ADP-heptose:LPS heptosyltransferase
MHVKTMQRIDFWVGVPLCALLSVINWLCWVIRRRRSQRAPPKRILFIELSEMGSAIIAYPTLRHVQERFAGAEIHFLIFRRNIESIELPGIIPAECVHVIQDSSLSGFAFSTLLTLIKLRLLRFDVIIDLELFSRCTALMTFLIGATTKVGFFKYSEEGLYRGNFLTHRVAYNPHFHISQNFSALLEAVDSDIADEPLVKLPIERSRDPLPRLDVGRETATAREHLMRVCSEYNEETQLVLFNPDPGLLDLRGWGAPRYRELAERLLRASPRIVIGVVGLGRSSPFFDAISSGLSCSRMVNLCGVTKSMRELLGFFSLAGVMVTNDSGPAHFAPLVGMPTVTLFGPESPHRYEPLSSVNTSLYANLSCSPCFSAQNHRQSVCKNNRCMQALSVDSVFAATLLWLSNGRVGLTAERGSQV